MLIELIIAFIILGLSFSGAHSALSSHKAHIHTWETAAVLRQLQTISLRHNTDSRLDISTHTLTASYRNTPIHTITPALPFSANKTYIGFSEKGTANSSGSIYYTTPHNSRRVTLGIGYSPVNSY